MTSRERAPDGYRAVILGVAALFCAALTGVSYLRWASFSYRTFDLAFYVQGLWQLLHARFDVSLLRVPILGNHVEPIVVLIAPIFALVPHPLTLVFVQNALLATLAPVAYAIAGHLGYSRKQAALLATALLIAPATCFVALHEFHPEALAAPFLLLMLRARLCGFLRQHWLWFVGVLACKENMALLLIAYCIVHLVLERRRPPAEVRSWYLWPLITAVIWFVAATKLLLPALNSGAVDYLALYDRLGASPAQIFVHTFTEPARFFTALTHAVSHGNLLPGLLLPFLALPLLRPRWLLISAPVLFQHLLSWRSSEWTVYFHYAAPLLPLFWMGAVEGIGNVGAWSAPIRASRTWLCSAVVLACITAQLIVGPAPSAVATLRDWPRDVTVRRRQQALLAQIPPAASVIAPLPYLSHLAMRPQLYSLHHLLKGLRTLSRAEYHPPPPPNYVLIDYSDSATFDPSAGYYHSTMRTTGANLIPSSDRLLHNLLKQRSWASVSSDEQTLLCQTAASVTKSATSAAAAPLARIDPHTSLLTLTKDSLELSPCSPVSFHLQWLFDGDREVFPWMELVLTPRTGRTPIHLTRGLCAPEVSAAIADETWRVTSTGRIPPGDYSVEAIFFDNTKRAWALATGQPLPPLLCPALPLGPLKVAAFKTASP